MSGTPLIFTVAVNCLIINVSAQTNKETADSPALELSVLFQDDESPLTEALVAQQFEHDLPIGVGHTDGSGRVQIRLRGRHPGSVTFSVFKTGYVPVKVTWPHVSRVP